MPSHAISLDTPTNSKIRKIVQDLEQTYTPEPDKFIYGGGRVEEYSQSGNNGAYPSAYMEHVEGGGPKKKMRAVVKGATDFKKGFDQGISGVLNPISKTLKPVSKLAKTVAPLAPLLLALGEGDMEIKPVRRRKSDLQTHGGNIKSTAKKSAKKLIEVATDKVVKSLGGGKAERGRIVSKIMKEQGLSLPMASKYVKEHGLYQK